MRAVGIRLVPRYGAVIKNGRQDERVESPQSKPSDRKTGVSVQRPYETRGSVLGEPLRHLRRIKSGNSAKYIGLTCHNRSCPLS
jgi:hypothetical protein